MGTGQDGLPSPILVLRSPGSFLRGDPKTRGPLEAAAQPRSGGTGQLLPRNLAQPGLQPLKQLVAGGGAGGAEEEASQAGGAGAGGGHASWGLGA